MLNSIFLGLQAMFALVGMYQLILAFFGWRKPQRIKQHEPNKSFAILVAAHNEEKVIGALLENLNNLKYPRDMFDVFVICDNCSDSTAKIVKNFPGVYACERFNKKQRGKGFAIEWMLKELWENKRSYDGVVMLDADNLVDKDFLIHMNSSLCEGHKVIQGYLDTKNPSDSWISASYGITYWFCNRFWQLPRTNLKMANFLGGTGMCFEATLLKEMGWGATSLVEDLEFSVRCIMRDIYPVMNFEAKVYDEKPISLSASVKQRLRWMQGHFSIAFRYFIPLLWRSIKGRSITKLDTALYTVTVYNVLISSILTIILFMDQLSQVEPKFESIYYFLPGWVVILAALVSCLQFPLAMALEKVKSWRLYLNLLLFPIFLITWWPITIYAFFTQNNKTWSHTQHSRVLRLEEVQGKKM